MGFSVIEDFLYFNSHSVNVIYGRAIFTSFSHIIDTGIVAYALALAKFHYKKNAILFGALGFLIACITHGVYDFFIFNDKFSVWVVPFIILLAQSWWFVHAVTNCLNNSSFYKKELTLNTSKLSVVVSGGLLLLITIVFLYIAIVIGEEYAISSYFYALAYYFYPLYFFSICINRIDVFPGDWDSFSIKHLLKPQIFLAGLNPKYTSLIGKKFFISPYGKYTKKIISKLPLKADIIQREKIDGYKGWFKLVTKAPIIFGTQSADTFFLRTKDDHAPFHPEERNVSSLYMLKNNALMESDVITLKDLLFFLAHST